MHRLIYNRLLRKASGFRVHPSVDASQMEAMYREVKMTPTIAGFWTIMRARKNFQDLISQNTRVMRL